MNKKRLLRKLSRQDDRVTRNVTFVKKSGAVKPTPAVTSASPEPAEEPKRGRKAKSHAQTD